MNSLPSLPDHCIELPPDLDTPCAVVNLPVLRRNIERMAEVLAVRGQALRPHAKTHSCTEIGRLQLANGAAGLTVGTLRMAEAFASAGFDDLFIAAPTWISGSAGPRLRALHDAIALSVGVDSAPAARLLAEAVAGSRHRLRVVIEVDSGEHRSGVRPSEVVQLARVASEAGLDVRGLFTHGGHGYAKPGAAEQAASDEVTVLEEAAGALRSVGYSLCVLSVGSTPTVWHTPAGLMTEQRPGTYVFNDRQQVGLGSAATEDVALVVAATVTSTAVSGQVILDAGAKALAKDRPDWLPGHGAVLGYPSCLVTGVFDFHAVVDVPRDGPQPKLGEVVAVVPNHVCAAVNLARELVVTEGGQVTARWPIDARG